MKTLLLLFLFLFISSFSNSQDFRKVNWGMSSKEVINLETFNLYDSARANKDSFIMAYEGSLLGVDLYLWYVFYYDSLVEAIYDLNLSVTANKSYSTLTMFLNKLKEKYGSPDQEYWDCSVDDKKYILTRPQNNVDYEFGLLFFTGDLKQVTYQWEISNVIIALSALPEKIDKGPLPKIKLSYMSLKYSKLKYKSQKEYSIDPF